MGKSKQKMVFIFILILLHAQSVLKAKDSIEILADKHGIFDETKGMVTFEKNVSARMLSTGAVLYSDRLEIYIDPISRKPNKAKAEGHVKLLEKNGEVSCDLAIFKKSSTSVELLGKVKVRTPQARLDGDRFHYNYETEQGRITALPKNQVTFTFNRRKTDTLMVTNLLSKSDLESSYLTIGRANEIFVYRKSKKSLLQGNVAVKDVHLHSELFAERVELFFTPYDEIEEIIANSRFLLVQNKRRSKADSAVFNYRTEIVTLKGNALVEEPGEGIVASSTIKMHIKESKGQLQSDGKQPIRTLITID